MRRRSWLGQKTGRQGKRGGLPPLSKLISEALTYLAQMRNYAPTTVDTYQRAADLFLEWLTDRGLDDDVKNFTGQRVHDFAQALGAAGYKPSTVVMRLSALSSLAQTLMKLTDGRDRPYMTTNPARAFEWPAPDEPETTFLLPDELAAFLAVERPIRESIVRDVFVDTGARVSELCRLDVGDVLVVDGRTVLATTVKGRRRRARKRHLPLSQTVATAVLDYLRARGIADPQAPAVREQPLFLSSAGKRWQRTALSSLMARIGRRAGISRVRVSAHKLRHTANVIARLARYDDGSPLDRLTRSRLLTHENPMSLNRYEHLLPDELWRAREAQRSSLQDYIRRRRSRET